MVEHLTFNQGVPGSIPGRPTIILTNQSILTGAVGNRFAAGNTWVTVGSQPQASPHEPFCAAWRVVPSQVDGGVQWL